MLEMLKFRAEVWFYNRYASLNKKRKAKEGKSNLYNIINDARRRTGFVK